MGQQLSSLVAAVQNSGGVVVPFVVQPEVSGIDDVVGGTASERADPRLGLGGWHREYARALALSTYHDMMKARGVQAFVVNDLLENDERLHGLQQEGVPFVALGEPRFTPDHTPEAYPHVETDNVRGIHAMIDRLRKAGCVHIGHIGFEDDGSNVPGSRRDAVTAKLGPDAPYTSIHYENSLRPQRAQLDQVTRWIADNEQLDAVVCDSDAIAYIAHRAALEADRSVEQDPALLGLPNRRTILLAGNDDSAHRAQVPTSQQWMTMRGNQSQRMRAVVDLLSDSRVGPLRQTAVLVPPSLVGAPGTGHDTVTEIE
ncbi:hypothetical protein [Rhodococcus sp. NPDC076796]|uniref:hypothetical protein n=1 Tax=Rhodococcus sp. NPDC076796 TaxID=3154859 RepID=UPI00344D5FD0